MTTERCRFCPVPCDQPCVAIESRHRRLCELIDPAHPLHHPGYLAIVAGHPPIEPPETRPSIVATRTNFDRMRRCEHWVKATDCGCGINRCGLGRGDRGRVSHHDCFNCPDLPLAEPEPT